VRQQNQATAEALLAGAGLTPTVVLQPVNDPSQDGIVLDQAPAPGADATTGEVVIITVGQIQNGSPGGDGTTTTAP
jgi:beta-lactam-binding protein with PASTA domain